MHKLTENNKKTGFRNIFVIITILIILVGIPVFFLYYQSASTGMSWREVLQRKVNIVDRSHSSGQPVNDNLEGEKIDFLEPMEEVGLSFTDPPQISHVQVSDLDKDGLIDIVVCDTKNNFVSFIRQYPSGVFNEIVLAGDMIAPAHVQVCDFDHDGDNDLMVAVLGMLFPNNDRIGSVVILENDGKTRFTKHVVVEKIARVSDVRAGDIDNDGDMDLAVAQFGYDDGETRWIENLGGWKFNSHIIQNLSGPINVEFNDIDRDGDLDIISLVSQEWEEIYCFLNDGKGNFQPKLLYGSSNEDFGSSGIFISDADKDGDDDILYTNGDAFDYIPPMGRPWHGVQWLENQGNLKFEFHRLCNFAGAYNCRPADIDLDSDIDLFVVSGFNFWDNPESQSFIWLENMGGMNFKKRNITNSPTHLLSLETGDINNDGLTDMVTGGMHTYPPYDRMSRIMVWINKGIKSE
jgi:hypothetical protein